MSTSTRPSRIVLAAAAGLTALVALTGCSALDDIIPNKTPQKHFDTYADAPTSKNSQNVAWFMPDWVPSDAEDIDVRLHASQPGYVIAFSSETGVDTSACTPVDGAAGGPAMTADFLPEHVPTTGLVTCGDGRAVAEVGDRWYGWTTKDPIPGQTTDDQLRPAS